MVNALYNLSLLLVDDLKPMWLVPSIAHMLMVSFESYFLFVNLLIRLQELNETSTDVQGVHNRSSFHG